MKILESLQDLAELKNTSNPIASSGMQPVVLNLSGLKDEILAKIALRKGADDISYLDLTPTDPDLIEVLCNGDERWTYREDEEAYYLDDSKVIVRLLPRGVRYLVVHFDCCDSVYDEDQLILLNEHTIYTA